MENLPYSEINTIPSELNTSQPTGVAANLASVAKDEPNFDGITIADMRGNPLFERCDDIDKIGLAQKKIIETTKSVRSKSAMIRSFNENARRASIPSKK